MTDLRSRLVRCLGVLVVTVSFPGAARSQGFANQRLNQDATLEIQNEQQIALNPTNPLNMVVVWRDLRNGTPHDAWGYTFDGGLTWTDGGLFFEDTYADQSDPAITVDAQGNFYAVVIGYTTSPPPTVNDLLVQKSTDGGVSWGPRVSITNQPALPAEDKEYIACDRTDSPHSGNLYVSWTRFATPFSFIKLRRSTDQGATWGSTINVSDSPGVQFSIPVVGRQGEVFVAWNGVAAGTIMMDCSTDGGITFGTDRTVTTVTAVESVINGPIDSYSSPHMDADITDGPWSGRLYIAFRDKRDGLGDNDIWVISSDDQGVTWTPAVRINDDVPENGLDQSHPWLVVDNLGIVTVVFLDRRDDPSNLEYHCYLTQSTDGGATWSANDRVSTQSSNPQFAVMFGPDEDPSDDMPPLGWLSPASLALQGRIGEYIGVVSWNGRPTPVWTDIRNGNQCTYVGYRLSDVGVAHAPPAPGPIMRIAPNPAPVGQAIRVSLAAPGPAVLRVYDAGGRALRSLDGASTPGGVSFEWDGRGPGGRRLGPGVYFLRVTCPAGVVAGKAVRVE